MDVTFTLTAADLRQFNLYCLLHRPMVIFTFLTTALGAMVLIAWAYSFLYSSHPPVAEWWWFPLAVAVVAFNLSLTRLGVSEALKSVPGSLGGVWIGITPAGVEERTALTDTKVLWARIREVVATSHAVYLFTDRLNAYCTPRRAFATPAAAETFLTLARSAWKDAHERIGLPTGSLPRSKGPSRDQSESV